MGAVFTFAIFAVTFSVFIKTRSDAGRFFAVLCYRIYPTLGQQYLYCTLLFILGCLAGMLIGAGGVQKWCTTRQSYLEQ